MRRRRFLRKRKITETCLWVKYCTISVWWSITPCMNCKQEMLNFPELSSNNMTRSNIVLHQWSPYQKIIYLPNTTISFGNMLSKFSKPSKAYLSYSLYRKRSFYNHRSRWWFDACTTFLFLFFVGQSGQLPHQEVLEEKVFFDMLILAS